ncbi:MAG: hypothetical protein ACTHU0_32330, partial [Kofleriaceae bacterium]
KPDDGPEEIELEGERATAPDDPGQAAPARAAPRVLELPDPVEHPSLPQVVAPARGFAWEPFGYLRLQYVAAQNDPNVAFVGRDDGFELQNARIGVRGTLDARAAFVISIDGAVDERVQINVPEGKLRVGLRDAYADVALARRVVARAGYFQPIVDPQALIPDPSRAFVDRPLESRGVRATEGFETQGLTPGRSIGAALRLDPGAAVTSPAVGFELAVQNGADEFTSNNDNDKPAVSATLLARLPRDGWLFVAGRYNARSLGDLPARRDENDLQASAGFQLNAGPLSLGGGGIVQRTTFPSTQGPVQNAFGAHAQLMFRTGVMVPFAFGYRFGILDPSSLLTTDRVMEHTAAAVLGVTSYRMRLQLQLVHVVEQRALSNSRAQLAIEVAL